MTHPDGHEPGLAEDAVALVAGLADLAVCGLSSAVGGVSGLLRRADLGDLLVDGKEETKARGRLLLDRHAAVAPAHMEVLARTVTARAQAESGRE
ncbi:polyprenyl synthetase [Streptomyces europaeiscabiei]|uniref:polyprenyl synthetase n=1 Tax=Streptomyces europaeiscabiei TaxID=146819 RepID=UPI0029B89F8C|nr:polyprenyl synthetase [Streptomyces europaeiscabiei]MDX3697940.1 polyprenyl synthetase [Streptomyces europaeiscabiei]